MVEKVEKIEKKREKRRKMANSGWWLARDRSVATGRRAVRAGGSKNVAGCPARAKVRVSSAKP